MTTRTDEPMRTSGTICSACGHATEARREVCHLIIPVDAGELNPNRRRQLRLWLRTKKRHRELARFVWIAAGKPRSSSPVIVHATIRRGRTLDRDNATASLKAIFDGLFNAAITPNDSAKWVRIGAVIQETSAEWGRKPEVEVLVEVE